MLGMTLLSEPSEPILALYPNAAATTLEVAAAAGANNWATTGD